LSLYWLATKTPELAEYNWGPDSMGLALDVFKSKLEELIANLKLVLRELFMMEMFSKFITELPPMQEYGDILFKNYHSQFISRHTGATVVRLHEVKIKSEAFNPKNRSNW